MKPPPSIERGPVGQRASSGPGGARHARALWAVVGLSTLIRLAAAARIPILDDEAHYWVWANHLMWGYPDHPPMIAALVAAGTRLLGDSVLGVRIFPILLGTGSTLAVYALARRLFSPQAGLRAALLFQVVPAFAAGGIMAAPDAPLGIFWLLAMLWGWTATRGARWAWPAAGAAAGLAIQCKMAGGAVGLALAGFVLTSPSQRRWLLTPGPYLAAAVGALVLAPLVWWNAEHGWATLRRALAVDPWIEPAGALANAAVYLGAHLVYYAPLGFAVLVAALVETTRLARHDERFRFLAWSALPTLAAAALASLEALAKPHYTGPALLAGVVAAAGLWPGWRARRLLRAAVGTSAALTLVALFLASVPTPLSEGFHQEARGWQRVANEVERVLPTVGPAGRAFVLAEDYQAGSQLLYATRNRVPVVVPFRGFVIWEPPSGWIGRNGLLMDHLGGEPFLRLSRSFERLQAPYLVPAGPGRTIRLYPGLRFRGVEGLP